MMKQRTKVFVGTTVGADAAEITQAAALSTVLINEGYLPVLPLTYEHLGAEGVDLASIRLTLLSECPEAIWVGTPSDDEIVVMHEVGIIYRRMPTAEQKQQEALDGNKQDQPD